MCALRDSRAISATSLACQYRLSMTPKRPAARKIGRRKKPTIEEEKADRNPSVIEECRPYSYIRASLFDQEEEEYDFDAEDDFMDGPIDNTELSQKYYISACADLSVRPIKCIYKGLNKLCMTCKGLILQHEDVKACTIALVGNSICETIEFDGNEIGQEGGRYFGDVITRNAYLTEIRLSWNGIGSLGAECICKALCKNNNVRKLDLTGNGFREEDGVFFKELLEENSGIKELYLGHNYFREIGGEQIAQGLEKNDFVQILDLSWNHLRLKGATAIGKALANNIQLEVLNVSWNGFYMHGIVYLGDSLGKNQCLLDLDISCNRLSEACIGQFLKGLQKNTTLLKLRVSNSHRLYDIDPHTKSTHKFDKSDKMQRMTEAERGRVVGMVDNSIPYRQMAHNHITHTGAAMILEYIKQNPNIALDYIDLGDQHVHDDFVTLLGEIKATREIEVKYGRVWTIDRDPVGKHDQTDDEVALLKENPHYVLMEFMRIQKLRLVDLFHQMDKDNSRGITVKEFMEGLKALDMPMKEKPLEKFVKNFDSDRNGEIDYFELLEANKAYKETLRAHIKTDTPVDQTDIGRIQKLIRKIMINREYIRKNKPPPQATGN